VKTASPADERQNFWPRAGPAGIVPDLGDDRPCSGCGYNLRGLPFDTACPECGAEWGIDPSAEPVAWNDKPSFASFFQTVIMVLTAPGELSGHIWKRDMIWMRPARRFRAINVALATVSLSAVILTIQAQAIGLDRASWCAPVDLMAVLWWFITLTRDPQRFLQDKGNVIGCKRAAGLSAYMSAPLVLSPLHLAILLLPVYVPHVEAVVFPLILHAALIAIQILLMASAESALLWQLVQIPRAAAFAIAMGNMFIRCLRGAVYVVAIPAVMASMANSVGRG
jgi:hypothetical protein